MSNYRFSGHETFQCRHFWLKKGYDFLAQDGDVGSDESLVKLGVGKNMVASIVHWMKAFHLISDGQYATPKEKLTVLANTLFSREGVDPYLEDKGTLWLLHFQLLHSNYATIYKMIFDDFRKTRVSTEFTSKQVFDFISRKLFLEGQSISENTLHNDIKVFLRSYLPSNRKDAKTLEDDYSSVFIGLNLISLVPDVLVDGEQLYSLDYDKKTELPEDILLFCILSCFEGQVSIPFHEIQNQVSDLFLCNREGTDEKLLKLQERRLLVYKEDAGRREVQIKESLDKWKLLNEYYG